MAGTYGEPGKNPFALKGIAGVLSPVVNAETGVTQIYRQGAVNTFKSLGTYNPSTGKFTPDPNAGLSQTEIKALSSTEGINNIKNATKTTTIQGVKAAGGTDAEAQAKANKLISPNSASNSGNQDGQGSTSTIDEEKDAGTKKEGTRTNFPQGLKYPSNLQIDHQDIIRFTILEYKPRSLSEPGSPLGGFDERSSWTSRSKGDVSLPIQGGITDTNAVSWGSDTLTAGQKAAGDIANSMITKGIEAGAKTTERIVGQASGESGALKTGLAAFFTEQAIGASNILSRTQGLVQNPNMELLFTGPSLRPFSFTFKLSARGTDDREQIRKIIRFFKQGMAVQRSEAQLFLKAPHTFKIQYLHKAKDHPYINYIKECALQSFTVNYTPEVTYMTFADGLMTSYEITMQFQELEPIFNDDYATLDQNKDSVIGY
jgi:hypothetical protein